MPRAILLVGLAAGALAATFEPIKLTQYNATASGMVWIPGG